MTLQKELNGLCYLESPLLSAQYNVKHLFSTRLGGVSRAHLSSLNLGFSLGDEKENVIENFKRVCSVLQVPVESIFPAKQVHEDTVRIVTKKDIGSFPPVKTRPGCDALITAEPGVTLAVFYADCLTALFYDPVRRVAAAAHAGWRGTQKAVFAKTAEAMNHNFGCRPSDIICAFSPSIRACCFETDNDVPSAMKKAFKEKADAYIEKRASKWHLDLAGINRMLLTDAGVPPDQIDDSERCTACESGLFWSHRKTKGQRGVCAAFIALI